MKKIVQSSRFKKDVKRSLKRGHKLRDLEKVITLLASGKPLEVSYCCNFHTSFMEQIEH